MKKSVIDSQHERLLSDARQALVDDTLRGYVDGSTAWCDFSGFGWIDMTHLDQLTEWNLLERRSRTAGVSEYRLTVAGHKELIRIDNRNERFWQKAQRGGVSMELNDAQIKTLRQLLIEHTTYGYTDHNYLSATSRELAHLLECGFIRKLSGFAAYRITDQGRSELAKLFSNPPDERAQLIEQRTALETQLAAVNARLAALEPKAGRGEMTEAGITRLIGDSLQNGE